MPPKRKTASAHTDDSPTKRRTRSSGALLPDTPPLPAGKGSSPKKLLKTYGRKQSHASLIVRNAADHRKDEEIDEGNPEESSEDELNLSPSRSHKPSRNTSSSVMEVTIFTKKRTHNNDAARRPISPIVHQNLSTGKHSSRTANNHADSSGQDDVSDEPPLSLIKAKTPSSIKVSTPLRNLRKRRQDSDDGAVSPPHSPKKLKQLDTSHPPSTARRNLPIHTVDNLRSPSPALPNDEILLSPSKKRLSSYKQPYTAQEIPAHLRPCLNAQKGAILRALHHDAPAAFHGDDDEGNEEDEIAANEIAFQQLTDILSGTVTRGEGNSCLLLGPRGSGKTKLVEKCLSNLSEKPFILRLSGWIQSSDRLAMREIAYQLGQQSGDHFLSQRNDIPEREVDDDDDHNPFLETSPDCSAPFTVSLPPSSQLPGLISLLPTLSKPTILVLDGFDLFALHPRQSLLYCLLDTAQSCRAGAQSKGLAVIGITSRMDTISILEKRVKSRFSGRMIRTAPPRKLRDWVKYVKTVLFADIEHIEEKSSDQNTIEEWRSLWGAAVQNFLEDKATIDILDETFSITRDIRILSRLLTSLAVHVSPVPPFLMISQLTAAAALQRSRLRFPFLHSLSYPSLCLLVASVHADTAGRSVFTFEMLHEYFRDQVRASMSAPVQVNGGSIGMVRCSREVLMSAFEHLITMQIFLCVTTVSPSIPKEFLKYRCIVDRTEVKKAIEMIGQVNLKKWLTKAQ